MLIALGVVAVAMLGLWWWTTERRWASEYRHSPGMATAGQVKQAASRRALAKHAKYTRPGLSWPKMRVYYDRTHHRLRRRSFREVGARIGRVGFLRMKWFGMSHEDSCGILAPQRVGKNPPSAGPPHRRQPGHRGDGLH